ncbi:hypothetical protein [Lacihabitans sp. CS3-21]
MFICLKSVCRSDIAEQVFQRERLVVKFDFSVFYFAKI